MSCNFPEKSKTKNLGFCVIVIEKQRAITQRHAITIGPILFKMVLIWAQGLNKKKVISLGAQK